MKKIEAIFNKKGVYYFSSNGIVPINGTSLDSLDDGSREKRVVNGEDLIAKIKEFGVKDFKKLLGKTALVTLRSKLRKRKDVIKKDTTV